VVIVKSVKMKKALPLLILCCTAFVANAQIHMDITANQAYTLITTNERNPSFTIIDFRTASSYTSGHIRNAINIDYYSSTLRNQLNALNKNVIYLVYCQSGSRSNLAMDIMLELGFIENYNIIGGINAWTQAGYQLVTQISDLPVSLKAEIRPNPASGYIFIKIEDNNDDEIKLNIYTVSGILVRSESGIRNGQQVGIGDLPGGMYIIEFKSGGLTGRQKLIIQR
jgi:rhodanese-related sulfurtransferase